jgi:hypothetical protein
MNNGNGELKRAVKQRIFNLLIVAGFGLIPAFISQIFEKHPVARDIHIRSFRYGKDPAVIRCNRGDTLRLTFSTDDTGHSFFLEEFDTDAKVSPARDIVEVFKTTDPTEPPVLTRELVIVARHPGILNYLVAKSNYRCHVWCGPMHAFEHGKLIILPNTLLVFSLGCLIGILVLSLIGWPRNGFEPVSASKTGYRDLLRNSPLAGKLLTSRWPQLILMIIAMFLFYVVILASLFGTKMSGRNLGVLLMWGIWLFFLVALVTPLLGRTWCTICPLPLFGDLIQRGSAINPHPGSRGVYRNKFTGLFLKWPARLQNGWSKLIVLMILTTFSTTLVANPKVTGYAVVLLLLVPTIMSPIFELRAFCRYLCPVSVFVGPFSRMSPLALRNKSQKVCDRCKPRYCQNGSKEGWACPYGLNTGAMNESTECGLCLECYRSCLYNNVTLYSRPFGSEMGTRNIGEAWTVIAVFTLAAVYSVLYLGHWPMVRDFVNILDKENWDLFGYYTLIVWTGTLLVMPGLLHGLSFLGKKLSGISIPAREIFLDSTGALLPLGMMLWIAFVIPMLFVNTTFIMQSLSDPFGWGWDFFGTASIPWHQFLPRAVPWLQAVLILTGLHYSLKNLKRSSLSLRGDLRKTLVSRLPMAAFLVCSAVVMIFFFTN